MDVNVASERMKIMRRVKMALRAEDTDVSELGRLFYDDIAKFVATHDGDYSIPSLMNTVAVSAVALSKTQGLTSFSFKMPAMGRDGLNGQSVRLFITRGEALPDDAMLIDTSRGDRASYPNPLWAGRFMSRAVRTAEDSGHATRLLFSVLMLLQASGGSDGLLSAIVRPGANLQNEPYTVQAGDINLTFVIETSSPQQAGARKQASVMTLQIPGPAVSRTVISLRKKGYKVANITQNGDWSTITYVPEGA